MMISSNCLPARLISKTIGASATAEVAGRGCFSIIASDPRPRLGRQQQAKNGAQLLRNSSDYGNGHAGWLYLGNSRTPSFDEGGCPIGAVILDNETREIIGKGHNTLVRHK
jgi:hypothetical protein